MKGSRIVLPQKMQRRALILAHEGHQGVVRTKARLREKVWWARMDKDVEAFVRECYPCQLVGARPKPEPIRSTPLPQGPWEEIAIDLCITTALPSRSTTSYGSFSNRVVSLFLFFCCSYTQTLQECTGPIIWLPFLAIPRAAGIVQTIVWPIGLSYRRNASDSVNSEQGVATEGMSS